MKQSVSPVVAAVVIALVVIVAGFFVWRSSGKRTPPAEDALGIPPEVQREFQRRGTAPTGGEAARSSGAPGLPAGVPTSPPSGGGAGTPPGVPTSPPGPGR